MSTRYRIEKDSLGEVTIDDARLFGAQTQRSLDHFRIGWHIMPKEIIQALFIIKKCAALANAELGVLDSQIALLICNSIASLYAKDLDLEFPLSVWQTGSGTQTNMNVNEVIANKAAELTGNPRGKKIPIHPNDHVNCSQSSNDVFPTAMHISFLLLVEKKLLPACNSLIETFKTKEIEFTSIIKVGRTHLMDAVPMRLSDEFSAFRAQIEAGKEAILNARKHLLELAIGGTAIGTGVNCPPQFKQIIIQKIAEETSIPFIAARNSFESLSCHDSDLEFSGALRRLAVSLMKIANDIRLLASGPRCGIGELILPENEPGSSIMPGKVNPTQCESMAQVACQVLGNDAAISFAATHGQLQLHVFKPLIAKNCIESIHLLADSICSFNTYCLKNIQPNTTKIKALLDQSLMLVTALSPLIGYDKAAEIALWAHHHNTTLKEAVIMHTSLTEEQFNEITDPEKML